ncbi:intracellular multiplication protein IcmJ [Natronocella acetinitrilica]|uniref:Intracellular multiplication protein IcmJ n=1 Tax=Natronocella acetinitrilica TaxID=414046 RepID=A0AAE3G5L2_9GAMM|nr:HNH endonuclease [Natronocella acetinitrilica]MCP1674277.1 intracellular multiplication protein IcmJ [Natronocella acetinitrilica]
MTTVLRPIELSVKRGQFRADDAMSPVADAAFKQARSERLRMDNHTCQFCGFAAGKYQEVHHVNDDHADNRAEENLVTACPLCHLCHHVGFAGAQDKAVLVYFGKAPGITQADLNQIVRALWIGRSSQDRDVSLLSINLMSRLLKGTVGARRLTGTSDPTVLGDFLLHMDQASYARRGEYLDGLFLLPLDTGFQKQIEYWRTETFKGLPVSKWVDVARQYAERWAKASTGKDGIAGVRALLGA